MRVENTASSQSPDPFLQLSPCSQPGHVSHLYYCSHHCPALHVSTKSVRVSCFLCSTDQKSLHVSLQETQHLTPTTPKTLINTSFLYATYTYNPTLSGFKYSFVDQNIEDMNITEVAQEWTENRNVVREIYNSSLEGVLQAIRNDE